MSVCEEQNSASTRGVIAVTSWSPTAAGCLLSTAVAAVASSKICRKWKRAHEMGGASGQVPSNWLHAPQGQARGCSHLLLFPVQLARGGC